MITKVYHEMDYAEFEKLIQEKLGFKYESVAENEWNNMSNYTCDDVKKSDVEKDFYKKYELPYVLKSIEQKKLWNESFNKPSWQSILTYMVSQEMLPEGNYIIEVYW